MPVQVSSEAVLPNAIVDIVNKYGKSRTCRVFMDAGSQMIAMKAPCDKYDKMFEQMRVSPEILELEANHKNLMDYLTEHTGQNITNIEGVEDIYNTLEIEELNNLTLPTWVNETLMETMRVLAARNLALYSETQYMQRVKGGVLVKNIIDSMERILKGEQEPRLYLYSGHDITLVHILRTLQLVGTSLKPSFGASLIFELYSNGGVKMIYRDSWDGNPEILEPYECSSPCDLQRFRNSLEAVLPSNWKQECELKSGY
nr:lysosomal acid phosphatase-like [Leptinotarsa decemlineata]